MKKKSLNTFCHQQLIEYRSTLKPLSIEALPDLFFFRPIAYLLVKAMQARPITPNQVSTAAIFTGISGAYFISQGTPQSYRTAGFCYLATVLLDCSDGMLARLKGGDTLLGRIVDGTIDYINGAALFLGIGLALQQTNWQFPLTLWLITLLTLLSMLSHSIAIDYQRSQYMLQVLGRRNSIRHDIELYRAEQKRLKSGGGQYLTRFLIWIYLLYCNIQSVFERQPRKLYEPTTYHRLNRYTLRIWLNIDQSSHYLILILSLWFFDLRLFIWYNLIFANLLFVIMLFIQKAVNAKQKTI